MKSFNHSYCEKIQKKITRKEDLFSYEQDHALTCKDCSLFFFEQEEKNFIPTEKHPSFSNFSEKIIKELEMKEEQVFSFSGLENLFHFLLLRVGIASSSLFIAITVH